MSEAPERITAWLSKDGSTRFEGGRLFPAGVEVEYIRADRIEELEAANRGLVRLNETTEARAEAAETLLSEVVRALINIERIYYMEAANPDPATIRRMAAQMNGVANTVLSSLSLESEEVARIMMTQAVRETQE